MGDDEKPEDGKKQRTIFDDMRELDKKILAERIKSISTEKTKLTQHNIRNLRKICPESEKAIREHAGNLVAIQDIADILLCDSAELMEKYGDAILQERAYARAILAKYQMDLAKKKNAGMLVWLGKQHLEQQEPEKRESKLGGEGGFTINIGNKIEVKTSEDKSITDASAVTVTPTIEIKGRENVKQP